MGVKVGIFSSGCREEKTSQTLTPKSRLQNNFQTPGRKSRRLNRTFPTTLASRGLVSATRLKVSAHDERAFVTKMSRAREHRPWCHQHSSHQENTSLGVHRRPSMQERRNPSGRFPVPFRRGTVKRNWREESARGDNPGQNVPNPKRENMS